MKKHVFISLLIMAVSSIALYAQTNNSVLPSGKVELFDGFEHGNYWIWAGSDYDQWGSHKYSAGTAISKKWASEGKHSLECKVEPMPNKEGWYDGLWFYDGSQNFAGAKYVALDIYNPTSYGLVVSMVFQVTDSWNWKNTDSIWVNPEETRTLVFDVSQIAEDFDEIRRIQIQMGTSVPFKNYEKFYVDNIRVIK